MTPEQYMECCNKLGKEGWELIDSDKNSTTFKRPLLPERPKLERRKENDTS